MGRGPKTKEMGRNYAQGFKNPVLIKTPGWFKTRGVFPGRPVGPECLHGAAAQAPPGVGGKLNSGALLAENP